MEEYIGINTKTEYSKTRIKVALFNIIYLFLLLGLLITGITFTIMGIVNYYKDDKNIIFLVAFLFVLSAVQLFFSVLIIIALVSNFGIIIKFKNIIKYYNENKLINVKKMMIPYDYKLWLVAAKNTFHPMSMKFIVDGDEVTCKTAMIFTNNENYYGFPKLKMPKVLVAKNYVTNWAYVGYDEENKEVVVIRYEKGE